MVEAALERVALRCEAVGGVVAALRESSADGEPAGLLVSAWPLAARLDLLAAGDLERCLASAWQASENVAGRTDG